MICLLHSYKHSFVISIWGRRAGLKPFPQGFIDFYYTPPPHTLTHIQVIFSSSDYLFSPYIIIHFDVRLFNKLNKFWKKNFFFLKKRPFTANNTLEGRYLHREQVFPSLGNPTEKHLFNDYQQNKMAVLNS